MKLSTGVSCLAALCVLAATSGTALGQDEDASVRFTVSGIVTDAENMPIDDARVFLIFDDTPGHTVTKSTTSDDSGGFAFQVTESLYDGVSVVVYKGGLAVGFSKERAGPRYDSTDEGVAGQRFRFEIMLEESVPLTLNVTDPDCRPVDRGQVRPGYLQSTDKMAALTWGQNPDIDLLTRGIDDQRRVTIDYLSADAQAGILVDVPGYGTQRCPFGHGVAVDGAVINLLPMATVTVTVTLTADDTTVARNREIALSGRPERKARSDSELPLATLVPFEGIATVTTDEQGHATARVPAGTIYASLNEFPGASYFAESQTVDAEPSGEVAIELKLQPGIRMTGKAQTPDGDPVAGVGVAFVRQQVITGDDGTFEFIVPRERPISGRVFLTPIGWTRPYETTIYPARNSERPGNDEPDAFRELPPLVLRPATPVSGIAVDKENQPVAGANVTASWVQTHDVETYFTLKSDSVTTDDDGRFRLNHVFPDADVRLTVPTDGLAVSRAESFHTDAPKELTLTVTSAGMVPVTGIAKGSDGVVIPGADIEVVLALVAPKGQQYGAKPIVWNTSRTFNADENGRFTSPGKVPRLGKYSISVAAPDYLSKELPFQSPPEQGPAFDLGDIVLTKARTTLGVVKDSSGQPIAGATVWSWAATTDTNRSGNEKTTTTTDESGRFKLDQVHPRAAVALVEMDGFRLTGTALRTHRTGVSVTLFRADEAIPPEHIIQPVTFDDAKRHAAARKLVVGILPDQRNSNHFYGKLLDMLVRINPDVAAGELVLTKSAKTRAETLAKLRATDDALAEAEGIDDPYSRAYARFTIIDESKDMDEIREVLASALLDAKAVLRPDRRAVVIANIASRFADLGDIDQAGQILRDELPQVRELSTAEWSGFARGYFAAQLARVDPETALALAGEADEDDRGRHFQNIAHVVAATNPDVAEEALKRIGKFRWVDEPSVRVAYRMASVDADRALKLLDHIDLRQRETERCRGLGVIAWAVKDSDPPKARELLQQAFAAVPKQHGGRGSRSEEIFGASIMLLRFAEVIDPENLTDSFWRTVSRHAGPVGGAWSPDDAAEEDAERQARLALLLSLYDATPGIPQQIMDPVFEYWETQLGTKSTNFTDAEGTFMAMALTDPERAVDFAIRFHEKLDKEHRRYIPQPWEVIGNTLTPDRQEISATITREVFHRWVIDQYDL